jgi:branched-chain amino acid transport system permease protein
MGGIIIGVVLFLPNGIAGLIYSISNRFTSSQKEHGREHV